MGQGQHTAERHSKVEDQDLAARMFELRKLRELVRNAEMAARKKHNPGYGPVFIQGPRLEHLNLKRRSNSAAISLVRPVDGLASRLRHVQFGNRRSVSLT
jgi:hypothetical protein